MKSIKFGIKADAKKKERNLAMKKSVRNAIALIVIAVLILAAAVAGGLGYLSFGGVAAWRL